MRLINARHIEYYSWEEFKGIICYQKNLPLQQIIINGYYYIWTEDSGVLHSISLEVNSQESADFEDHHRAQCNYGTPIYNAPFALDSMVCAYDGIPLTEINEDPKKLYFQITKDNMFLAGGQSGGTNICEGDWFSMEIVDHDNLLGYGVDFVLKQWVFKKFLRTTGCVCETPYAGHPPAGFYIMITYHKSGERYENQPNPKIWVQLNLHEKVI